MDIDVNNTHTLLWLGPPHQGEGGKCSGEIALMMMFPGEKSGLFVRGKQTTLRVKITSSYFKISIKYLEVGHTRS